MTNEEAKQYFIDSNETIISVAKDENKYNYETQQIEDVFMRRDFEAKELAIKALDQQPCDDCISREAVETAFHDLGLGDEENGAAEYMCGLWDAYEAIKSLPPVQPRIEVSADCISRTELLARIDAEREHLLNIKMDGAEHIVVHHARRIIEDMTSVTPTTRWIPVSERLPSHDEYIKNNEMFIVSDGNRSYFGWFDFYDTKKFVKPTIAGFCVDNAVIAWMPLPEPYKESEDKE